MRILVQGIPPLPDLNAVWAIGRRFPKGERVEMDVLDQDEEPELVEATRPDGSKTKIPDPARLGRQAFEELKADARFSVLADPGTDAGLTQAALDSALAQAKAAAARVVELEAENAELRARLAVAVDPTTPPPASKKKAA